MFCDPLSFGYALMKVCFASGMLGSLFAVIFIYIVGTFRECIRIRVLRRKLQSRGVVS